jgi:hypothetical protein
MNLAYPESKWRPLQQVAYDQLAATGAVSSSPRKLNDPAEPARCVHRLHAAAVSGH